MLRVFTWRGIWKIASDFNVQLQEPCESDVGRKACDAIVGNAMFSY